MTIQVKINGEPAKLEIDEKDLSTMTAPKEFSLQEAADYMACSTDTIRNRRIPKNKNGKYSITTLNEWMK